MSSGDVAGPAHGAGQAADLDPQVVALLDRLRAVGAPPVQEQTPAELRQRLAATAAVLFGTVDEVASVEDRLAGGVRVRVYEPRPGDAALVYYHGGGWVAGSVDTHDGIVRALAARSGRTVVSVDYRLAPEHPYPAGLEDARTAARWALDQFDAVAVGGDSSGATLAAVVARELPVALQLLICPALDARCESDSYARFAAGTNLTREAMRWYWAQYLGGADGDDPDASPLRAPDLSRAAPAIIAVAECDPLRDDGLAYAERLRAAGVPVSLRRYEGMVHDFVRFAATLDRASAALDELASELGARLG